MIKLKINVENMLLCNFYTMNKRGFEMITDLQNTI